MKLRQYIDLILYKTFADLRTEAAKTYIGILWWIFDPLIFMAIFYVVFGLMMQGGTEDFVPFLLVGLTAWRWFQGSINNGGGSILNNRGLIQQVYIPKAVFPLVVILTDLFKFAVVFFMLLIFLWVYGFPVNVTYLALPLLIFVQLILITSFTFLLAGIVPFFPDFKILANHLLQLVFFLSGIFFTADIIPEQYKLFFYLNPMANIIEAYRDVLMYARWPRWPILALMAGFSLLLLFISYRFLAFNEHRYPKLHAG